MSDLKNVIVNALNADGEFHGGTIDADGDYDAAHQCCGCSVNLSLEPIEKAVTDHFLDREKVRAALIDALTDHDGYSSVWRDQDDDDPSEDTNPTYLAVDTRFILNDLADRLIEGLAGGGSE